MWSISDALHDLSNAMHTGFQVSRWFRRGISDLLPNGIYVV